MSRLAPDALALVGPTRVQLLVFLCFSISVVSCCRVLIVDSSLHSFDFYFLGVVALMSQEPFTRTEEMSCVYHGRTKGEVRQEFQTVGSGSEYREYFTCTGKGVNLF